jgi:membrane protein
MPRDNNTDRTVRPGNAATKMSGDAWAGMAIAAALKTYGVLANRGASRRRSGQVAERSQRDSSAGAGRAGKGATKPTEIPKQGWWAILKRTWTQMSEDNVSMLAGGVAFFAMLSIFPALTALVSLYGLVADPRTVE